MAASRGAFDTGIEQIRTALEGHLTDELELQRQIRAHFKMPKSALSPEQAAVSTFRCHLFRYLHGLKGSSYVRGQLNTMRTIDDIRAALDGCFEREAKHRNSVATAPRSPDNIRGERNPSCH